MANDAQRAKLTVGGGAVAGVLLLLVGWLALIHPKLSDASSLHAQADDVRTQNSVLQRKVHQLAQASKNLSSLTTQLRAAYRALPYGSTNADLNSELASYAKAAGVKVTSWSAGTPTPAGTGTQGQAPPAASSAPAAGGMYSITVNLVSTGTGTAQLKFLHNVEYGARAVLISTSALVPAASTSVKSFNAATTMTTTFTVFVQPITAQAEAQLRKQLGDPAD